MKTGKKKFKKVVTKKVLRAFCHRIFTERFRPKIIKRWQNKNDKKRKQKNQNYATDFCMCVARMFQFPISSVCVLSVFCLSVMQDCRAYGNRVCGPVWPMVKVKVKVALQTYWALHGDAPQYLRQFTPVADIPSRQRLRSSTSDNLCVPAVRLPTVGRRAFSVAGARVWNALPADVTSASSLFTLQKRLKLHLFPLSYPGLVL